MKPRRSLPRARSLAHLRLMGTSRPPHPQVIMLRLHYVTYFLYQGVPLVLTHSVKWIDVVTLTFLLSTASDQNIPNKA